jgi:hypothetical protein
MKKIVMNKNLQYGLYVVAAIIGGFAIVKIVKAIKDNADKGGDDKTPEPEIKTVYVDTYLSKLPLGVDNLTWGSKVPAKYLPKFNATAAANSDATYKANAIRVQTLLNQRLASMGGAYPKLIADGKIGGETTKAMIVVANAYNRMDTLLPLSKKEDINNWLTFFNVKAISDSTNDTSEFPFYKK